MRKVFFLLVLLAAGTAGALGRLVQPDGSILALGEVRLPEQRTLLFAPQNIPAKSWLTLPAGSQVREIELVGRGYRKSVSFPRLQAPRVRYALEVPAQLLSLELKGWFPESLTVLRTAARPESPEFTWVTRTATSLRIELPPWSVAAGYTPFLTLKRLSEAPWTATLSGEGTSRTFALEPSVLRWDFAPEAWGFVPSRIEVLAQDPRLAEVRISALDSQANLLADPATLLNWPGQNWRQPQREWFTWAGTSILVLVTKDYQTQDDYLKRLAFFVEKTGFRGRLWTDAQIAHLHGWNAHDYSAPSLAQFYTLAEKESFPLNPEEIELRTKLTASGILVAKGSGWEAGTGALLGISLESPPALRAALFVHEAFHGLYFTSEAFRNGVKAVWSKLPDGAKTTFRDFLAISRYDPSDEGLMMNEFQAYVLQRSPADWVGFFRDKVRSKLWLPDYMLASQELDTLVQRLYGFRSGKVSLVRTL